jgi:AbiV family abortive infection protein
MVTAQFLLEGAAYALQHSGTLLRDAVSLYRQEAYPSAIVLALFGREELGKYEILRGYYEKVAAGLHVSITKIRAKCSNHVTKQRRAVLSIVQTGTVDEPVGKLLRARLHNSLDSQTYQKADRQLKKLAARKQAEMPNERHQLRLSNLYVEPTADGTGWQRPLEHADEDAKRQVVEAVNDYALVYDRLVRGNGCPGAMGEAFQAWAGRPEIPEPVWPWSD